MLRSTARHTVPLAFLALSGHLACTGETRPVAALAAAQGITVEVQPPTAVVARGSATQFTALVTGTVDTTVAWRVVESGGGSVDATGRYVAPGSAGTFHVQATSNADPARQALATVTVQPPPPPVTVTIAPATAAVDACRTLNFTATVTGTTNTAVTWSVQEGATGGAIAASGAYTAPATGGTYHVVATSAAAPAVSATQAVAVTERILSVAVNPPTVTVQPNGTAQFTATVTTTCGSVSALQAVAVTP
jgi:hypothetical protein